MLSEYHSQLYLLQRIRIVNGRPLLHSANDTVPQVLDAYSLLTSICKAIAAQATPAGSILVHHTPGHCVVLSPNPTEARAAMAKARTWLLQHGVATANDEAGPVQLGSTGWDHFQQCWIDIQDNTKIPQAAPSDFQPGNGTTLATLRRAIEGASDGNSEFLHEIRKSNPPSQSLAKLWHDSPAALDRHLKSGLAWLRLDVVGFRRMLINSSHSGFELLGRGRELSEWFATQVPKIVAPCNADLPHGHSAVLTHAVCDDIIVIGDRQRLHVIAELIGTAFTQRWNTPMRYAISDPSTEPDLADLARSALRRLRGSDIPVSSPLADTQ